MAAQRSLKDQMVVRHKDFDPSRVIFSEFKTEENGSRSKVTYRYLLDNGTEKEGYLFVNHKGECLYGITPPQKKENEPDKDGFNMTTGVRGCTRTADGFSTLDAEHLAIFQMNDKFDERVREHVTKLYPRKNFIQYKGVRSSEKAAAAGKEVSECLHETLSMDDKDKKKTRCVFIAESPNGVVSRLSLAQAIAISKGAEITNTVCYSSVFLSSTVLTTKRNVNQVLFRKPGTDPKESNNVFTSYSKEDIDDGMNLDAVRTFIPKAVEATSEVPPPQEMEEEEEVFSLPPPPAPPSPPKPQTTGGMKRQKLGDK